MGLNRLSTVLIAALSLSCVPAMAFSAATKLAPASVKAFYQARGGAAAWTDNARFDALLQAIEGMAAHGLDPADYHLSSLRRLRDQPTEREEVATDAWLSAAAHMALGKLSPVRFEPDWTAARRQIDLVASLETSLANGGIAGSLDALAPQEPAYRHLLAELARLRAAEQTAAPPVAAGALLRPGMTGSRIAAVRQRLAGLGYAVGGSDSQHYDQNLEAAVRAFQQANGLESDGIIGDSTTNALNLNNAVKIAKVRVNLERWRWLPDDLGPRHLRVNIASFEATSYDGRQPVQTFQVIIGRPYRKTPVFSDEVEYVVFNPWWETPHKLARLDKLPAFKKDPAQVQRLGFHVLDRDGKRVDPASIDWRSVSAENFPFRLRQAPGERNALGRVKIMFPNRHSVYLHDTPSQELFAKRERAFSSGCIRVQNVMDLVQWLLSDKPGWDRTRVDATAASGRETTVTLERTVPVHILYTTAVPDTNGVVRYLNDLYSRDARVLEGLGRTSVASAR